MQQINLSDLVTNQAQAINQVLNNLEYGSYKANRDYGCSHELLVKNGIGNDDFLYRYNAEKRLN